MKEHESSLLMGSFCLYALSRGLLQITRYCRVGFAHTHAYTHTHTHTPQFTLQKSLYIQNAKLVNPMSANALAPNIHRPSSGSQENQTYFRQILYPFIISSSVSYVKISTIFQNGNQLSDIIKRWVTTLLRVSSRVFKLHETRRWIHMSDVDI